MANNVYWILELAIKDGELENFRSLMEEMTAATERDEPGALNYESWISDDNSACHIYERYADSDATMAPVGNFGSKFDERFMNCVDITNVMVYGNPNEQVKEALAGFSPTYMGSFGGFAR